MFEPVAFIKYDEAVRKRVNETGISQFGVIETDEVYSHFGIENTVKVTAKSSTFVKGGRGTSRAGATVNKGETHYVTCVHSSLFEDRVWQFSLPTFETQKLHCLGASDWSTPPS